MSLFINDNWLPNLKILDHWEIIKGYMKDILCKDTLANQTIGNVSQLEEK